MTSTTENTNEVTHNTVAKYIRVSTEEQNPDNHRNETTEYINHHFPEAETLEFADIYTGTTTVGREQFGELRETVETGRVDVVVTTSVSRVARSIRDLEQFVGVCEEHGTAVHFTRESLKFDPEDEDPYAKAMLQMLGVFAELEAKITQQRTKEAVRQMIEGGHKWGRAPFGFEKENGDLYPTEDLDRICSMLDLVDTGELSQSKAAHMLGTSRTTVKRAITEPDRRELYGLE